MLTCKDKATVITADKGRKNNGVQVYKTKGSRLVKSANMLTERDHPGHINANV